MTANESQGEKPTDGSTDSESINWESIARTEIFVSLSGATNDLEQNVNQVAHQVANGEDVTTSKLWELRSTLERTKTDLFEALGPIVVDDGDETAETIVTEQKWVATRLFTLAKKARDDRLRAGDVTAARELLAETDAVLAEIETDLEGGADDE